MAFSELPPLMLQLIAEGTLISWRKRPNIFTVKDCFGARITWKIDGCYDNITTHGQDKIPDPYQQLYFNNLARDIARSGDGVFRGEDIPRDENGVPLDATLAQKLEGAERAARRRAYEAANNPA